MKLNFLSPAVLFVVAFIIASAGQIIHIPILHIVICNMALGFVWGICWPMVEPKE